MSAMTRLRARVAGAGAAGGADRGSLAMALLVSIVGAGLAALLIPLVLVQFNTSHFDDSRARELNAAEAGTDIALGMIRSAADSSGVGQISALPCTTSSGASGSVAGAAGLTYRVRVAYYTEDPLGQSPDWLAQYTASNGGHGMICSSGKGTYYPPTKEVVPSYALITSTGSDSRGSRTLQSTYFVRTTNANVAGGTIYVYPSGGSTYCMDAGSARPIAGVTVQLQPCAKPVVQQQAWAYNTDLSIQLVSSVTSAYPNGLCLSAIDGGGASQSSGDPITLQPCAEVGSAPWSQLWSVDNSAHLEGAKPDKSDIDGLCINAASQGAGVSLQLATCAGTVTDTKQTWVPSPDVGAGMAGASNNQMVNFQQFGRCIDVTNQSVNGTLPNSPGGNNFLIAYTCKQNPNPAKVAWNQKFAPNSSGEWVTTAGGSNYCMTSPLKVWADSNGPWVTVTPCPATPTAAVTWTQYGATDSDGNPEPTLDKYTIQDANGYCLALTTDTSVAYNGQYSKVVVAACDGSTVQKWNAAADIQTPALKNLMELGPTGD